jgi:uncharacterized protein YjiS (DUF1127 family)
MSTIFQLRSAQASLATGRPGLDGAAPTLRQNRSWASAAKRAITLVLTWQERARQRHHLEYLSDHMLRDIGLTRADVLAEVTKPFWQR